MIEINCINCGKKFFGYKCKKYCKECTYENLKREARNNYWKNREQIRLKNKVKLIEHKCDICNKIFFGDGRRKFCSIECYKKSKLNWRKLWELKNNNKIFLYRSTLDFKTKVNKWRREKNKNDLSFKYGSGISSRLRQFVNGKYKKEKIKVLIGCTAKELKNHLEKQFKPGMTWDNHGYYGWHIDHIKPCCSFDLSKREEQIKCFHYTNLQPLWRYENQTKSGKIQ